MFIGMRRSKLRVYEDILCSLHNEAKTIDEIAYSINTDCMALRLRIGFLLKNKLVEEKNYKKVTLYALTSRGLAIYKTIAITNQLKKLQSNIQKMDKKLQTIHIFSGQELEKQNLKK
jgi:predicted transcriptional regulator